MTYLWQLPAWPVLRWDNQALLEPLGEARYLQGRLFGQLRTLGVEEEQALEVETIVDEAVTTSAIEGENLPPDAVRSSIARRLGLDHAGLPTPPRNVDGVVEMLLDATLNHALPLTHERLKGWQAALFPTGYSGIRKIVVGDWRGGLEPMQVVSGQLGAERVHFVAPPAHRVPAEMDQFLHWWSVDSKDLTGMIRAAVGHLWFETIHPFEDGNGRVGRALVDMALAQEEGRSHRLYSLSSQILAEGRAYYQAIEAAQSGSGDITSWLTWFLGCVARAIERSEASVQTAVAKGQFWQRAVGHELNARQTKLINRLLDAGPGGFKGGLTNKKYCAMTKASKATATRDLTDLLNRGILVRVGQKRGTRYDLNWELTR
ncbi:MAG: Fic family protein [Deltaproteobacteria bacterium]|nr:Fic family protein [Deltaproteobacteria bacterium]